MADTRTTQIDAALLTQSGLRYDVDRSDLAVFSLTRTVEVVGVGLFDFIQPLVFGHPEDLEVIGLEFQSRDGSMVLNVWND